MHQPSTFSKKVEVSNSMYNRHFSLLCSHLFPKHRMEWAQFDRRGHDAGGLGAIRAMCRTWQAFKTFLVLGTLKVIPRVSATSPGIGFLHPLSPCTRVRFGCKLGFSARIGYTYNSLFLHRAPRYGPAAQQQSSPPAAAAWNSMRVRLLL